MWRSTRWLLVLALAIGAFGLWASSQQTGDEALRARVEALEKRVRELSSDLLGWNGSKSACSSSLAVLSSCLLSGSGDGMDRGSGRRPNLVSPVQPQSGLFSPTTTRSRQNPDPKELSRAVGLIGRGGGRR